MITRLENLTPPTVLKTLRYRLIRFLAGNAVVLLNADLRMSQTTGVTVRSSAKNLLCVNCCFADGTVINHWSGGFTGYRNRPVQDSKASTQ
jgi:hypothetical protein